MGTTLRNWWRNAEDRLDLMWTEPLSWVVLLVAAIWITYEVRKRGHLDWLRSLAIAALGVWLVAAFAITIYPIRGELDAPTVDRFYLKSFVPLWGTIEAIADSGGYVMTEAEWLAHRQLLADEQGIPVEQIDLPDRRVRGPGVVTVLKDPIGNVVLFLPLGFLAALGWQHMRDPRKILLAGAAVSGSIELSQALFGIGSLGTIDDVIFNSLGALLGWVAWRITVDVYEDMRANVW